MSGSFFPGVASQDLQRFTSISTTSLAALLDCFVLRSADGLPNLWVSSRRNGSLTIGLEGIGA